MTKQLNKKEYDNFVEDMLPTFVKGLTLDKINNNGNYESNNCKWLTAKEQANNRRTRKELAQ